MAAVAPLPSQQNVHPLLRHPRPITRDSAKAQRMLRLLSDTDDKSTGLHREKSKTTKWLERPLYSHLGVSDEELEAKVHESKTSDKQLDYGGLEKDADLLERWTRSHRPTSFSSEDAVQNPLDPKTNSDVSLHKRKPVPLKSLRPVSYHSQHLLTPEWTASPATMSPNVQLHPNSPSMQRSSFSSTSSSGSFPQAVHPQTWPAPLQTRQNGRQERPVSYQPPSTFSDQGSLSSPGHPQLTERRPRPTSFATYQHRDRRNSKIASSRGLRNNSYPNFAQPNSGTSPRPVPGESIESDVVYNHFDDNEVGPPSPSSPLRTALSGFDIDDGKVKNIKKPKHRWSTIPETFKKLTVRRSSIAAQEQKPEMDIDSLRRMNLTEENLRWHVNDVNHIPATTKPSTPGAKLLPTPTYSPLEFKNPVYEAPLPPPFAPWADSPPSPALSQEKRQGSDVSLSPTRKRAQSRLSIDSVPQSRPESLHSRQSSYNMPSPVRHLPPPRMAVDIPASPRNMSRKGTPSLERTCIICKTTKDPSAFIVRRISANCWHEPSTCFQCLQSHIEKCVTTQGWENCSCPECKEPLTYEDIGAFANEENSFIKWED